MLSRGYVKSNIAKLCYGIFGYVLVSEIMDNKKLDKEGTCISIYDKLIKEDKQYLNYESLLRLRKLCFSIYESLCKQ